MDIGCGDGTLMPHLLDEPVKQNPPSKARKKAVKKGKLDMPAEEEERGGGSIR